MEPSCHVTFDSCNESNLCDNNSTCINTDERTDPPIICLCTKNYIGKFCHELAATINLNISFSTFNRQLTPTVVVHIGKLNFAGVMIHSHYYLYEKVQSNTSLAQITYPDVYLPERGIILLQTFENSTNLYGDYYLVASLDENMKYKTIDKTIDQTDRCSFISEVMNETILNYPSLKRIKYYNLPCIQRQKDLKCFYDHAYFCLCIEKYQLQADCYFIDHTKGKCVNPFYCVNNGFMFTRSNKFIPLSMFVSVLLLRSTMSIYDV